MSVRLPFLISAISLFIFSCQKEASFDTANQTGSGSNSGQSIIGNWKFVEFRAKTKSTGIGVDPVLGNIKTVTTSDYATINNSGTLKIEASKLTATDLTYSVNSIAKAYIYEDNLLTDSLELPFAATIPPSTSTSTYKRVNADSLYIDNGIFTAQANGSTTQTKSGGVRIKLDENKMYWTSIYKNTSTENINGVSVTKIDEALLISTFQKL